MTDAVLRQLLASGNSQDAYHYVVNEMEQLVWQFILWPTAARTSQHTPRVLEMAALVEVLPDVYIHSSQLQSTRAGIDSYLRVWGNIRHPDGSVTERNLLVSRTDTYPDPEIVAMRPGMDPNLTWWDDLEAHLSGTLTRRTQEQLAKIAQLDGVAALLPAPNDPAISQMQQLLAQGEVGELLLLISQRLTGAYGTPGASARPNNASSGSFGFGGSNFGGFGSASSSAQGYSTSGSTPFGTSGNPGSFGMAGPGDLQRQAEHIFTDWHRKREEAHSRRDVLAYELRQVYFSLYPSVEQAVRHTNAFDLERALAAWIYAGCPPPPEEQPPALPPGISPEMLQQESLEQRTHRIQATVEKARTLAQEFERKKAQISELSQILERLCELVGGHATHVERDATGAATTRCLRCGARLDNLAPDKGTDWIH